MAYFQKCREPSTEADRPSQQTLNDVMMAAKLKEVNLTCQLNESKEKLLIIEQQVTSPSISVVLMKQGIVYITVCQCVCLCLSATAELKQEAQLPQR